ncbi:MAG: YegS/Rv2252/BmrU family lipid kinase [Clostridia bacterium]|nr:YegS/Rv2252/BmrU family lipid kinase [Clostridia bacterium]
MKKAILFYNPMAGDHGVAQRLDYIIGRFQDKGILIQPYRIGKESEKKLTEVLKSGKYEYVVASGGDGTLNNIANIILKNKLELPMGIIPAGTCNDFARSLKIPNAIDQCIDIILKGRTYEVDTGLINEDQYFLSTFAGGFFVDVSFNTHHELKKNFGPFAYYLKALSEVVNIRSFNVKVTTDKEIVEENVLLFLVLNGRDAGGFTSIISEADISDGIMDIVLIKNCNHIDLGGVFFKVLSQDTLVDRNVTKLRAKSCTIECDADIAVSIDGEKGPNLPVSIRFLNRALRVFVR